MDSTQKSITRKTAILLAFLRRVISNFIKNQGILLSGAVAFYTLLSIIPFFTLLLVALSHVVETEELLRILDSQLRFLVPGLAGTLLDHATTFLQHRHAVGWIGILLMLFFSSTAFTVLENTISLIFHHRVQIHRRHAVVSAVIPYLYIMMVALAFFLLTVFAGTLHLNDPRMIPFLPWSSRLGTFGEMGMHLIGLSGMVLLLTSFYLVMPRTKILLRNAFIGGLAATALWEIVRNIMVWYFETLSMVNVIYGSLAAVVVALLSLEAAGTILLICAQMVSELEHLRQGGRIDDAASALCTGD